MLAETEWDDTTGVNITINTASSNGSRPSRAFANKKVAGIVSATVLALMAAAKGLYELWEHLR